MEFAQEYINSKKLIYESILEFIDSTESTPVQFDNLLVLFQDQKINENLPEIRLLLHLLAAISVDHKRSNNFFDKIEQILKYFQNQIKSLSNIEIFNIFKSNKKILLFLIEEKLLTIDKYIASILTNRQYRDRKYHEFFFPEIKPFIEESERVEIAARLPENFEEERKRENFDCSYIAQLIQQDSIDDFIIYVNKNNIQIDNYMIEPTISETNSFLDKESTTLIQYAAFYGSIQIFKYLQLNHVELNEFLWCFAIHGRNPDLIHILEENLPKSSQKFYTKFAMKAIDFHHNEIANYIIDNLIDTQKYQYIYQNAFEQGLLSYNFNFFITEYSHLKSLFSSLCMYDYYTLAEMFLQNVKFNINERFYCGIKKNNLNKPPLALAFENHNYQIVKLLLNRPEINTNFRIKIFIYNFSYFGYFLIIFFSNNI